MEDVAAATLARTRTSIRPTFSSAMLSKMWLARSGLRREPSTNLRTRWRSTRRTPIARLPPTSPTTFTTTSHWALWVTTSRSFMKNPVFIDFNFYRTCCSTLGRTASRSLCFTPTSLDTTTSTCKQKHISTVCHFSNVNLFLLAKQSKNESCCSKIYSPAAAEFEFTQGGKIGFLCI